MGMELTTTDRGFEIISFVDRYGKVCSLQKSSLAMEDCVWFGVDDIDVKRLEYGKGWIPVDLPDGAHVFGRMHLTQEMVRELLPYLVKFAYMGEL